MSALDAPPGQLVLEMAHAPSFAADDYIIGASNAEAHRISTTLAWPTPVGVIVGGEGSGKTHLAHIAASVADTAVEAPLWFDGSVPENLAANALLLMDGLERFVSGDQDAIFHTLEAARAAQVPVLVTTRGVPEMLGIKRPDTLSRLRAGERATINAPDDQLFLAVAVKLFADRQLDVDPAVASYLLQRMERSYANLSHLIGLIDERSLAAGRRITKPLAGEVLAAYELSQN
ncbi:MAG: hypothetical protein AAF590_06675 [Pseudomonadota bacterium]